MPTTAVERATQQEQQAEDIKAEVAALDAGDAEEGTSDETHEIVDEDQQQILKETPPI
jgi:hypothetical protein